MSGKLAGLVWELDLDHAHAWVLMAMVDHADHDGGNIYPSIGLIAWKAGYSARQVQRIIKDLVEWEILVLERAGSGRGGTNVYRADLSHAPRKPDYEGRDKLSEARRTALADALIAAGGAVCARCRETGDAERGADGEPWHIDRIIPGAEGGRYEEGNVALLCARCSRNKGSHRRKHVKMSHPTAKARQDVTPVTSEGVTRDISTGWGVTFSPLTCDIAVTPNPINRQEEPSENQESREARARDTPAEAIVAPFALTVARRAFAERRGLTPAQIEFATEQWADDRLRKGLTFDTQEKREADWRTWIRNETRFLARAGPRAVGRIAANLENLKALEREHTDGSADLFAGDGGTDNELPPGTVDRAGRALPQGTRRSW